METFSSFFPYGKKKGLFEPLAATAKQKAGTLFLYPGENEVCGTYKLSV